MDALFEQNVVECKICRALLLREGEKAHMEWHKGILSSGPIG